MAQDYTVRLLIQVPGEDPVDAMNTFIERINSFGIRSWTFSVEASDGRLFHVTGHGDVKEISPEDLRV